MPAAKRSLRGLRNIKTLSGRDDAAGLPHRAYMKLACLEMERERRVLERKNALRRLKSIDDRIRDIEAEEAALRQGLGGAADAPPPAVPGGDAAARTMRRRKQAFKVKY